ncbi:uncharacterized protein TNCV_2342671 [Trichonephila clavipes]|nr:uncharacterized protein TNCV_2342671 [Trichonephila clavipes]
MDATEKEVPCVLWLMEFKSVTREQRCVRAEWNADSPTLKSIHQWERTLKEKVILVPRAGKYLKFFVIKDTADYVRDSFCRSPSKSNRQASNGILFCSNTSLYTGVTDLNIFNQSTHCTFCCGVQICTNEVSVTSLWSAIVEQCVHVRSIGLHPKNLGWVSDLRMNSLLHSDE